MATEMQQMTSISYDKDTADSTHTIEMSPKDRAVTDVSIEYKPERLVKKALNEDIYHLTCIMCAKHKKYPILLLSMTLLVLIIQFLGLFGLIWGYQLQDTYSTAKFYRFQFLQFNETLNTFQYTNANYHPFIVLHELYDVYGVDQSFDVLDNNKIEDGFDYIGRAKNFMGFMAIFILLIYMLQSVTSYSFLWYVPDYVDKYKHVYYIVKCIAGVNIFMIYMAWFIGIWTLFHVGGVIDIIDMILTPLGIVFILEVDDWMVKIYLLLDFEDDDGDDDYDGGEDLWVVQTNRKHIKKFKYVVLIIFLCMVLPPITNRIALEYYAANTNYFDIDSDMFTAKLAIITYSIIGSVVFIAICVRLIAMYCEKK
eukprot:384143_1